MATVSFSAVLPTKDRAKILGRTLESLVRQSYLPCEIIIIDASTNDDTSELVSSLASSSKFPLTILYARATIQGAAAQRNQGVQLSRQPWILFLDDDILFEQGCIETLWNAAQSDAGIGGISALITNQKFHSPGLVSRFVFSIMAGRPLDSYAGRVIGPAVNLLPDDNEELPELVSVDWLNLGCTLYRREALPKPVFDSAFTGYSMMEDLTLSLRVGLNWKLLNARTAKIYHDSQPASYKRDPRVLSEMELVNRHYVMTRILRRKSILNYLRLIFWEAFQLAASAKSSRSARTMILMIAGKLSALRKLCASTTPAQ